jgi:restriction endonuclease S subunit
LVARPDTHWFLEHDLPKFKSRYTNIVRLTNFAAGLRSGEYIEKSSYSDHETNYVYLTIGQFSGATVSFEELTFLDDTVGPEYAGISVKRGDIVITRSGTIGSVHVFDPPDDKIYIPSHHLAILQLCQPCPVDPEYIRLFLQSEFPRRYFWAFASGKSQKEISNWSIKSLPVPLPSDIESVVARCQHIESQISKFSEKLEALKRERSDIFDQLSD